MTELPNSVLSEILQRSMSILENVGFQEDVTGVAQNYFQKSFLLTGNLEKYFDKSGSLDNQAQAEKLIFTAYYLQLAALKLSEAKEADDLLEYSGQILEYVGKYMDIPSSLKLEVLRQAALSYDIGGYSPNSIVLVNEILESLEGRDPSLETLPRFFSELDIAILTMLSRKFDQALMKLASLRDQRKYFALAFKTEISTLNRGHLVRFLAYLDLVDALVLFCQFMKTGEMDANLFDRITKAEKLLETADDAEGWSSISIIHAALKKMCQRSIWKCLTGLTERSPEYMKLLSSSETPITELWESQRRAVSDGILDPAVGRAVVSMPTSSGKTIIAEFAIVDCLSRSEQSTCIYVATSKALAIQVESGFERLRRLGYKVSLVVGSYDAPEIEELKLARCRVLITTPEKLSQLEKSEKPVVKNCSLFVFDEAQMVGSRNERGVEMEFMLLRINFNYPRSRMILLSPVMRNTEEIAKWIGGRPISIDWHPTRTLRAILQDESIKYFGKTSSRDLRLPEAKGLTSEKKAVRVALLYGKIGPTLVFCSSKRKAMRIAKLIYEEATDISWQSQGAKEALADLSKDIEIELGRGFPLSTYLQRGVAYHHADLPDEIKVKIEDLIKNGSIKYVTSTTTLAEGMNTPVSTVVIPYLYFKGFVSGKFTHEPITKMLFANIAGRAGRALQNTEGHVILFKPDKMSIDKAREYMMSGRDNLEPVISSLNQIASLDISAIDQTGQNLILKFQSGLLASLNDKLYAGGDPSELLDKTLFGMQFSTQTPEYGKLKQEALIQLNRMNGFRESVVVKSSPFQMTDFGKVCHRVGLSPESCSLLLERIDRMAERNKNAFNIVLRPHPALKKRFLDVLRLAFVPLESQNSETYQRNRDLKHHLVLYDWITGKDYHDIADTYFPRPDVERKIFDAFSYIIIQLTYFAPWVLWSLSHFLQYRGIRHSTTLLHLPAYAKYGVSDMVAAYFRETGIHDRVVADSLASYYRRQRRRVNFEDAKNWLFSLEASSLKEILRNASHAERSMRDLQRAKEYMRSVV